MTAKGGVDGIPVAVDASASAQDMRIDDLDVSPSLEKFKSNLLKTAIAGDDGEADILFLDVNVHLPDLQYLRVERQDRLFQISIKSD